MAKKRKSGYPQNLDNGVMRKPTSPFTGSRTSKSMNFESIIAGGENPNGQTSISLTEISRGGRCKNYRSYKWGGDTEGPAWNRNPLNFKGE